MPNNVTDSSRDEEKWEKAEGIAKKQLGHEPKSKNDWAYVMGIYKRMKPDHQFQSEKSASAVVEQWMARRVVARKTFMKLDRKLKQRVNADMRKAGLDGNGRFRKPQQGYSKAVEMMQRWNLEIDGTAHSHLFNQDSGQVTVDIAMTNTGDRFSPFPIVNSMLVIQFHKLENDRFEVLGYLS